MAIICKLRSFILILLVLLPGDSQLYLQYCMAAQKGLNYTEIGESKGQVAQGHVRMDIPKDGTSDPPEPYKYKGNCDSEGATVSEGRINGSSYRYDGSERRYDYNLSSSGDQCNASKRHEKTERP